MSATELPRCGDSTCPDPYCLSRCPECGWLDSHAFGCPIEQDDEPGVSGGSTGRGEGAPR